MSDEKQLELAAKAAGLEFWTHGDGGTYIGNPMRRWNPLADDGDALRLAVQLNIEFACFDTEQQTNAGVWTPDSKPYDCMTPYNGDKQAAVRRAIVRAAAEIGKAMP